jgi:hypothetical protein
LVSIPAFTAPSIGGASVGAYQEANRAILRAGSEAHSGRTKCNQEVVFVTYGAPVSITGDQLATLLASNGTSATRLARPIA